MTTFDVHDDDMADHWLLLRCTLQYVGRVRKDYTYILDMAGKTCPQ
jgi:hypothetical protein